MAISGLSVNASGVNDTVAFGTTLLSGCGMAKKSASLKDIELEPDAWQRFERAVDVVSKSPPQHRAKKKAVGKKAKVKKSK